MVRTECFRVVVHVSAETLGGRKAVGCGNVSAETSAAADPVTMKMTPLSRAARIRRYISRTGVGRVRLYGSVAFTIAPSSRRAASSMPIRPSRYASQWCSSGSWYSGHTRAKRPSR